MPPAVYYRFACLALWAKAVGLAVWLSQTNSLLRALLPSVPSFYARMTSADCEQVVPAGSHAQVEQTRNEDSGHNDIAESLCRLEGVTMVGVREVSSGHNDLADSLSRLDWVDDYSHLRAAVEGAGGEGESHRAYSEVAVKGGGVDAINLSKDQLEGPARPTAKWWGFTWNLTAVSQRRLDGRGWKGPGGAILSSSADKVLKFGDLLTLMEVERSEGGSRSEGGGALGGSD